MKFDVSTRAFVSSFMRMWPFVRPHKNYATLMLACLLVGGALGMLTPIITGNIIDALPKHDMRLLLILIGWQTAVGAGLAIINFGQTWSSQRFAQSFGIELRHLLASRLQRSFVEQFVKRPIGEITNRLDGDVQQVTGGILSLLPAVASIFSALWLLIVMPLINWKLALVGYAFIPLWFILAMPAGQRFAALGRRISEAYDALDTAITERLNMGGILRAKAFGGYDLDLSVLRERQIAIRDLRLRGAVMAFPISASQSMLAGLAPSAVLLLGGFLIARGECTIGVLVTFLGFLARTYGPITQIAGLQLQLITISGVLKRVFEVFDIDLEPQTGKEVAPNYTLRIERLSFGYDKPLIRDFTLCADPGEKILLMGPSGCGKSTLARLILGFYRPLEGDITVGDEKVAALSLESLRRVVGYVPQEANIFTGTIRENLTYANCGATEGELWDVLRTCELDQTVLQLPMALDEPLGSQGIALSGGQRQRLTIARALLARPRILILDEATSALDKATEKSVFANVLAAYDDVTMIVIAHKPPALMQQMRLVTMGAVSSPAFETKLGKAEHVAK